MKIRNDVLKLVGLNPTGDLGPLTAYTSRRHGTVWFAKSPPLTPPTKWQLHQRDRFRVAAATWKALDNATRQRWHLAARRARLVLNGYTLWVYWQLTRSEPHIRTIESQSGVALL